MGEPVIIDAHVHLLPSDRSRVFWTERSYMEMAEEFGVSRAVCMPNLHRRVPDWAANANLMHKLGTSTRMLAFYLPVLFVSPHDDFPIEQAKNPFVCGLKFHPSVHQVCTSDTRMTSSWAAAKSLNLPVIVHCGRNEKSRIKHLLDTCKSFKEVQFIGAHLGGSASDLIDECLDLLEEDCPVNLCLDTSAVKLPSQIARAVNILGKENILFGSDEPFANLQLSKACVELAGLSDDQLEHVFCKNAERIFRVS